ncbi:MAG: hypothetical protein CME06_11695 [Gemmatimonadetes bacterium]|nr:hypothetical protein [Gemmatimonadota bacterium]
MPTEHELNAIAFFTSYVAIAKDIRFWPRFAETAGIGLGVAGVSFAIGWGAGRRLFVLEI